MIELEEHLHLLMAFVRVKYRPPPIHPELGIELEDHSITLRKKIKKAEDDPYADAKNERIVAATMDPAATQERRVEQIITSDEKALRKQQYPTVKQRAEITRLWIAKELKEAKRKAEQEAYKKSLEMKLRAAEDEVLETPGTADVPNPEDAHLDEEKAADDEDLDDEQRQAREADMEYYQQQLAIVKEKKIMKLRKTKMFHLANKMGRRRIVALKLALGMGKRDRDFCEMLPWLCVGRAEIAADLAYLQRNQISHILNVSTEVPNYHEKSFVYCNIRIMDDEKEDIYPHLQTGIDFIKSCQNCRGRVFIHCTAGVSRAPVFAIAYIITQRPSVYLIDAFKYLHALRPTLSINPTFLGALGKLELTLGQGSSVLFDKHWRFYEFNLLRADGLQDRQGAKGVYRTTLYLLSPEGLRGEEDLLV